MIFSEQASSCQVKQPHTSACQAKQSHALVCRFQTPHTNAPEHAFFHIVEKEEAMTADRKGRDNSILRCRGIRAALFEREN